MKILAIIGSPRKGNTIKSVQKIESILSKNDDVEFEYIELKDVDLKPCIGCFMCIKEGYCPLKDDKEIILEKMMESDGIIMATPAYNFNVSGLMKNFIDRFAHLGHQPQLFNQHLMVVCTTAGTGHNEVIKYLRKYVGNLWGFQSVESIGLLTPPYKLSEKYLNKNHKLIEKKTERFYNKMKLQKKKIKFHHIEQFCSLRAIFSSEIMKNHFVSDYELYTSLRDKKFYFDADVNPFFYKLACLESSLLNMIIRTTFGEED